MLNQTYSSKAFGQLGYTPFGSVMPGRSWSEPSLTAKYKFSFNGKEKDDETSLQDYGMRIYNSALGRFLSVDPLSNTYPWYTPYQFCGNKPIIAKDLDGEEEFIIIKWTENGELRGEQIIHIPIDKYIEPVRTAYEKEVKMLNKLIEMEKKDHMKGWKERVKQYQMQIEGEVKRRDDAIAKINADYKKVLYIDKTATSVSPEDLNRIFDQVNVNVNEFVKGKVLQEALAPDDYDLLNVGGASVDKYLGTNKFAEFMNSATKNVTGSYGVIFPKNIPVTFQTNSVELDENGKGQLKGLVINMLLFPHMNVMLIGHTDDVGKESDNQVLSEGRATSAGKFVVSQGIAETRVATKGAGETKPLVTPQNTDADRAKNRRIEIQQTK